MAGVRARGARQPINHERTAGPSEAKLGKAGLEPEAQSRGFQPLPGRGGHVGGHAGHPGSLPTGPGQVGWCLGYDRVRGPPGRPGPPPSMPCAARLPPRPPRSTPGSAGAGPTPSLTHPAGVAVGTSLHFPDPKCLQLRSGAAATSRASFPG